MRNRQLTLFAGSLPRERRCLAHGGNVRKRKRKIARPWNSALPVHMVLRSSRARGQWSLLENEVFGRVAQLARVLAARFGVVLYRYANSGNHIHILARAPSRPSLQSFLRVFAGQTAQLVTHAAKGRPIGKFWDRIAYSRIVSWGREFRCVGAYVKMNEHEALGLRPPRGRKPGSPGER